jgi:hypothetical protein
MKKLCVLIIAASFITGCAGVNKHLWGYSSYQKVDVEPVSLYYSVPGVEDKIWFGLSTVQEQSKVLAEALGYEVSNWVVDGYYFIEKDGKFTRIACDSTGTLLYYLD